MKLIPLLFAATCGWAAASQTAGTEAPRTDEAHPPGHAGTTLAKVRALAERQQRSYLPFFERTSLSTGLYRLAKGSTDAQLPHGLDEVYHVVRGRARFHAGGTEYAAVAGALLFVAAGVEHRFSDITEDLEVVVFFSKARPDQDD